MTTPAGWHPDPEDPAQQRYWDGTQWTEHRAPATQAAQSQVSATPQQAVTAQAAPSWYSDPERPGQVRYWNGTQWSTSGARTSGPKKGMPVWLVVLLCVFVFPPLFAIGYGLYWMWSRKKLNLAGRWAVTAAAVLIFIVGPIVTVATAPPTDVTPANTSGSSGGSSEVSAPSYTVAGVEDDSFGATKRYVIQVVLPGDSTEDERMAIARKEVENLKSSQPFNAAGVFFWQSESDIGKSSADGSIDYAPGGDWSAADTVETGDYDSMEYSVQF